MKSGVLSEQLRGAKELLRELKNIGFEAEKIDNYGCYCKFRKEDRFGGEILTSDFSVVPKVRFIFYKKNPEHRIFGDVCSVSLVLYPIYFTRRRPLISNSK